jgi:hypothetical protein
VRSFILGDVLSITTGRLVSPRHIDGVYDILGYMTGENLFTHQLPRACDQCKPFVLAQHPHLANVDCSYFDSPEFKSITDRGAIREAVASWLDGQKATLGTEIEISPLPNRDEPAPDPIQELCEMVGKDRVLVVDAASETSREST